MNAPDSPVTLYTSLNLSSGGELAQELFSQVEYEAQLDHIVLSDHQGSTPSNLTPAMAAWYAGIASYRNGALDQVASTLDKTDDGEGVYGVFLERALSKVKDAQLSRKRDAVRHHREKHLANYERLNEAQKAYSQSRLRYAELMARHGREAKLTPMWYWPFLAVIGLAEMLINFEAFNAVSFFTPAIATGSTLAIAAGLAYSSHLHGTFLRQFHSRFGPHARDGDRAAAWRMFSLGSLCLAAVLAAVAYARNSYFGDILLENAILGNAAPSWLAIVGGSMLMNLVVWIVGVIGAFIAHDEDHRFPDALVERNKAEKKFRGLQALVNRPLQQQFLRIDAESEKEAAEAKNKDRSFSHSAAYETGRAQFAIVRAQDAKVQALLEAYRSKLLHALGKSHIVFEKQAELSTEDVEQISAQEYAAHRIELKYL